MAGQRDVSVSDAALAEAGVSPDDVPITLRPGAEVRLGAAVQRYLAERFGFGDGPLPDMLPAEVQVAIARALPFAEESNRRSGKVGMRAMIYTADLAQALGDSAEAMELRYKASAPRPKK